MSEIPDQRPIWDRKHEVGDHDALRGVPSPLAELAVAHFPEQSKILELGCGVGRDAVYFVQHGHEVIATDGSNIVVQQNQDNIQQDKLTFATVDMREPLNYQNDSFDVVYANLALHYYSDSKTKEIVREINRVLRVGGMFTFACKSYDSLHNSGEEVEPDVIVSPTGATMHLFSPDYAKEILGGLMSVEYLDEIDEDFGGRQSQIVRCIARK